LLFPAGFSAARGGAQVAASMNSETFAERRGLSGFATVLTPDEGSVSVLLLKQFDPEEEFCDTLHR
jgi:hypothetical protein